MSFAINTVLTVAMAATMLSESNCIDMLLPKKTEEVTSHKCICCEADLKPYWLQELEKIELLAEETRLDDDDNIIVKLDATQLVLESTGMMWDVMSYVENIFQDPQGTWYIVDQSSAECWKVCDSQTGQMATLHFIGLDTD